MSTANSKWMSNQTDEEMLLESELQAIAEEKKTVVMKTKEADKCLWKIREEERNIQERLHQLRVKRAEKDHDQKERLGSWEEMGNYRLKRLLALRQKAVSNEVLSKLPPEFRSLEREKVMKLSGHFRHLEEEVSSAQQILEETQLRQLAELPSTEERTELKQRLYRQQQQLSIPPSQHQSKYYISLLTLFCLNSGKVKRLLNIRNSLTVILLLRPHLLCLGLRYMRFW